MLCGEEAVRCWKDGPGTEKIVLPKLDKSANQPSTRRKDIAEMARTRWEVSRKWP